MKRNHWLLVRGIACLFIGITMLSQGPPKSSIPPEPEPTVKTLRDEVTDCTLWRRTKSEYIATLTAKIHELEAQVAELSKAQAKAPALDAKAK